MTCIDCGRPLRARGTSRAEFPGTMAEHHAGICGTCHGKQLKLSVHARRVAARAARQLTVDEQLVASLVAVKVPERDRPRVFSMLGVTA